MYWGRSKELSLEQRERWVGIDLVHVCNGERLGYHKSLKGGAMVKRDGALSNLLAIVVGFLLVWT